MFHVLVGNYPYRFQAGRAQIKLEVRRKTLMYINVDALRIIILIYLSENQ